MKLCNTRSWILQDVFQGSKHVVSCSASSFQGAIFRRRWCYWEKISEHHCFGDLWDAVIHLNSMATKKKDKLAFQLRVSLSTTLSSYLMGIDKGDFSCCTRSPEAPQFWCRISSRLWLTSLWRHSPWQLATDGPLLFLIGCWYFYVYVVKFILALLGPFILTLAWLTCTFLLETGQIGTKESPSDSSISDLRMVLPKPTSFQDLTLF